MLRFPLFFLLVAGLSANAQDTLRVMHYNLLNYGNYTTYCTSTNNNINNKDTYLKTILQFVKPEVFTVNEMGASITYADRILANSLNVDGTTHYQRAGYSNNGFSDLVNMLFYDSRILGLRSQVKITNAINGGGNLARVIDIYTLFYKSASLPQGDTIFLHVATAHLKAGSTSSDQLQRAAETEALVEYLGNLPQGQNLILNGDFNVGTSTEQAFQNLITNPDLRFRLYDPINMTGSWTNNANYASIHTQSTHTTSGCASSGGMDDRFDFILANTYVMNDSLDIKYVPGSYKAVGQDGLHFNQPVNSPANNSAPSNVINALYGMSDHLPVMLDLRVNAIPAGISLSEKAAGLRLQINNPFREHLNLTLQSEENNPLTINIYDLNGRLVFSQQLPSFSGTFHTSLHPQIPAGAYLLSIQSEEGSVNKIIIKN